MGADYSFEVKNNEIWVPAFFKHNNLSVGVATVQNAYIFIIDNLILDGFWDL